MKENGNTKRARRKAAAAMAAFINGECTLEDVVRAAEAARETVKEAQLEQRDMFEGVTTDFGRKTRFVHWNQQKLF